MLVSLFLKVQHSTPTQMAHPFHKTISHPYSLLLSSIASSRLKTSHDNDTLKNKEDGRIKREKKSRTQTNVDLGLSTLLAHAKRDGTSGARVRSYANDRILKKIVMYYPTHLYCTYMPTLWCTVQSRCGSPSKASGQTLPPPFVVGARNVGTPPPPRAASARNPRPVRPRPGARTRHS